MNAVPRNSGARKIRIFAETVSISARRKPPTASLTTSAGSASSSPVASPPCAIPNGKNSAMPMQE